MDWHKLAYSDEEAYRRRLLSPDRAIDEAEALVIAALADKAETLDLSWLQIDELPRSIAQCSHLKSLNILGTSISDLGPLSEVSALSRLNCGGTHIRDLSPLSRLLSLVDLRFGETFVTDLAPLANLRALTVLDCSYTRISDLAPLKGLTALVSLDCTQTGISDLGPLSGLSGLSELCCGQTNVCDLTPLRDHGALTKLHCESTGVRDLAPLTGLAALESLNLSNTGVHDLSPVAGFSSLSWLDFSVSEVTELSAISNLKNLKNLFFSNTSVDDLSLLSGLTSIEKLEFHCTPVSDLSPLVHLPVLTTLVCTQTYIRDLSPLRFHPSLSELIASHLPNCPIPAEHLSQSYNDNCLPRLRAYWANLDGGSEPLRKHKLFLLGNGTVGKTQLARRLRGIAPDFTESSTHGIQLHDCPLPAPADPRHPLAGDSFDARIWDFGGQDIYHGTHALFLKSRAIFLICWDSASENARQHETGGQTFRNYPLAYWLDYVRSFAGAGAQVILVQTKTDVAGAALAPPVDLARWSDLAILEPCRTSALTGRGMVNLTEVIAEAVGRIEAPALQLIGTSERKVADAIAARRAEGERTLTQAQFAAICAEAGLAGKPEHLLHFLHHAGDLFHASGLFGDQIIIDQCWALEAVYAVFERQECAPKIRAERGRFILAMLADTVWRDYTADEQRHFLAMMLQCGMAFDYIEGGRGETIYIAPDQLPDFDDPGVQRWFLRDWDPGDPGRESVIRVPLLHDGLIRALMVEIGRDAGLSAVYWKDGILFHDTTTRAMAMIAARWPNPEGWAGEIVITTQRSRAGELLAVLEDYVRKLAERLGLSLDAPPAPVSDVPGISDDFARVRGARDPAAVAGPAFTPGKGEPRAPVCYVSYAWSDGSAAADANEAHVDRLCADAEARGIAIIRDKIHLVTGDTISGFTEEIARADKVAALIGGRYWTRPDCFMELYGCWTESRSRPELFHAKVSEFLLPDAGVYQPGLVQQVADYWREAYDRCDTMPGAHRDRHETLIAEHGDSWAAQSRKIIAALQNKVRRYEGDFDAFTCELFAELEAGRYQPDHVSNA
jgi:internalin A